MAREERQYTWVDRKTFVLRYIGGYDVIECAISTAWAVEVVMRLSVQTAKWVLAGILGGCLSAVLADDLIINEFVAINRTGLKDSFGAYSDWIEIHNVSPSNVNLGAWRLTDKPDNLRLWTFPATNLPAGGFLVVFASGANQAVAERELHTNFELKGTGEYLALVRPDNTIACEFNPFPIQFADMSYGFQPAVSASTFVAEYDVCRYLVPSNGSLGTNWLAVAFDDSGWSTGITGIGYEIAPQTDYEDLIRTRVASGTTGIYCRFSFQAAGTGTVDILTLKVKFDDGFVAYLNGEKVAASNAPAYPQFNSLATAARSNDAARIFVEYDLSAYAGCLRSGSNVLAIHVLNQNTAPRSSDLLILPVLEGIKYLPGVSGETRYFQTPTPRQRNSYGYSGVSGKPRFSIVGGFYTNNQTLVLSSDVPGGIIRYTLDTSDPDGGSPICSAPLVIRSRAGETNKFSTIRTTGVVYSWQPAWQPPAGEVFKATVVRARLYEPGKAPGPTVTHTYFVDSNIVSRYRGLPVISLVTDPKNLFDDQTGIYVPGIYFTGSPASGNYYQDWEKPASIEFFDTNRVDGFAQNVGIKIQGASSRASPQKGLHVIARSEYGANRIRYPLFKPLGTRASAQNSFKRFQLRAWGSYRGQALIYDPYSQMLMTHTDLDIQTYRPCVVFIDGEYWGLHEIRESNQNSWYYQQYYGVDREDPGYDIIDGYSQLAAGDWTHWNATLAFIKNNDITLAANYEEVKRRIDVDNLILYTLHSCFVNHGDWPNQNEGKWRPRTPDGRWRWIPFDFDHSFHDDYTADMIARAKDRLVPFNYLYRNAEFSREFVNAYADHMNSSFKLEVLLNQFSNMVAELQPHMDEFNKRWPLIKEGWDYWLADMRNRIINRMGFERPNLMGHFGISQTANVSLAVAPPGSGTIRINTIEVDESTPGVGNPPYPWRGVYFRGVPIRLTAVPKRGYRFAGWSGAATGSIGAISLALSNDVSVTANFAEFDPSDNSIVISEIMYNPAAETDWPDADVFEFIELHNRGSSPVDLGGAAFTKGISFTFASNTIVPPGGYIVVVKDLQAFTYRYGSNGVAVAGVYTGSLANEGERIALRLSSWGPIVAEFEYSDGRGWPLAADGAGHSLVPLVLDDQADGRLNYGGNWRASAYRGGSPGREDPEPRRDVVLNEIMAHTDFADTNYPGYDSNDWIELFNTAGEAVSLANWYLSDDARNLKKWAIPPTNTIGARGWLVFDEVTGFHNPLTTGFGLNKAGEAVFLSYLPGNTNDRVADCVSFKGQERELSLGRYRDGAAWWYALTPTRGAANALPPPRVVISEIMYHPSPTAEHSEDNTHDEYVEIFNPTDEPVPLWTEAGPWRLAGGIKYVFPSNTVLPAKSYLLVVSFDPGDVSALDSFLERYALKRDRAQIFGPYQGWLSNRGERIALERPQWPDNPGDDLVWFVVDEVIYADQPPWPSEADGRGASLRRIDHLASGNDPANWLGDQFCSPGMPASKVTIASPRSGTVMILPFTTVLRVTVDQTQITGSVRLVEFFIGSNLLTAITQPPYECALDSAREELTQSGIVTLWARVTDDGGTGMSPECELRLVALRNGQLTIESETTAYIGGVLEGPGAINATLCLGETDGGTNKGAWMRAVPVGTVGTGEFGVRVDGLVLRRTYYYRWHGLASGGEGWAATSARFTVPIEGWTNRMQITFTGYNRAEQLTNFPALVILSEDIPGLRYGQFASSTGNDLRFLNAERTSALNYEIESWNTNGLSYVWVQVPTLSGPADHIWAYWGNPGAVELPPYATSGAVWSEGYRAVWHMGSSLTDVTTNRTPATNFNTAVTAGIVGECRALDGDDYIHPALGAEWYGANISNLTVSLWVKPGEANPGCAFGSYLGGRDLPLYVLGSGGRWIFAVQDVAFTNSDHVLDPGAWQLLTMVLDGGYAYAYKNGLPGTSVFSFPSFTPSRTPLIGNMGGQSGTGYCFKGVSDEVRISGVARSPAWIWASYMTVASNRAFMSYVVSTSHVEYDSDDDGMPDEWEIRYFGRTDAENGGAEEDWDGDGLSNFAEYVAGTDPTSPADVFALDLVLESGRPIVSFYGVEALTNYGLTERVYSIEALTNLLGNWETLPNASNLAGRNAYIFYTNTLVPEGPVFYRGRVRLRRP